MADAIVILLLENLSQVLVEEASWLIGEDVKSPSLGDQLKRMAEFLENCKDLPDELNQIRDLAHKIEGIVDDYLICTYKEMSKEKKNKESLLKYLPKLVRQPAEKDIVRKRMKGIKEEANVMYDKIKKKSEEAVHVDAAAEAELKRCSRRSPIVEEADLVGITDDVNKLVKRIVGGSSKLATISIVGMGGLGKTTVAKKVYNDLHIKGAFQHRAWVYVSQENSPKEIVLDILKCLTRVTEEMKDMNKQHLGEVLRSQLTDKKYLVVMDDVWKLQDWEDLRPFFPDDDVGSRILFTTRVMEVAKQAAGSEPKNSPHHLRLLNAEESWELFHKKALPGETCPPQWEKVGRRIAERCGGLPLAITALGRLLLEKHGTFDEWSRVDNQGSTFLSKPQAECKEILALSYKELPYRLKPCFLYLSAFPEDHQIPARLLIDLWVAEGFIVANPGETMEDTAETYLEKLVSQSLIQVVERKANGGVKTCSIHRLIRGICISEAQQQNFLQVQGSADPPPRRLAGTETTIPHIIKNPNEVKELRTLLCFNHNPDESQWNELLKAMRLLKVFKVSDSGVVSTLENQLLLKYFSLGEKSSLKDPSSLCNLPNLQVFDARSKSQHSAAAGIWSMRKLRRVYFQDTIDLPQPPVTTSSESSPSNGDHSSLLKDLQTLSTISPKSCTPEVFQKVPNLLKLGVDGDLNALSIENLKKLEKLRKLKVKGDLNALGIENLKKLEKLCKLKLEGISPLETLPLEMLSNLTELTLCNTQLKEDPMILLGSLKSLQTLKLSEKVYQSNKMVCLVNEFPQLKHLKFVKLELIREVLMMKSAMPNLEQFVVDDCCCLEWLKGVHFLAKLQVLDLKKPTKMLRRRMQELNKETQLFQLQICPLHENYRLGVQKGDDSGIICIASLLQSC